MLYSFLSLTKLHVLQMRKTEQLRVKRIEEDWKTSEQAKEFEV